MNSDNTSEYRDEDAAQYEQEASESGWHGHAILFGMMYEFVNSDETLLDIGIGTGLSSVLFHKAGLHISGFDKSVKMLKGCEAKGFSGKICQHDLRDVPYPYESNSFNHIISLGVLNFFADISPALKEAARIIKPEGIFGFAIEEQKTGETNHYTIKVNAGTEQQFDITMYRHGDDHIKSLLKNIGFVVLKDFEFLADSYPDQEIDVYLKIYITRRE